MTIGRWLDPTWSLPGESGPVVYAETLFENQTAGDELVSVLVDFDASQAFFGDNWRMTQDIASNGAARCLAQLPTDDRTWMPSSGAKP